MHTGNPGSSSQMEQTGWPTLDHSFYRWAAAVLFNLQKLIYRYSEHPHRENTCGRRSVVRGEYRATPTQSEEGGAEGRHIYAAFLGAQNLLTTESYHFKRASLDKAI